MKPGRVLAVLIVAALAGAAPAGAHHILGIPHYRYGEEYPQIPYMEVMAQVGHAELVFTHFPGFPSPGERVRFKLYVRDRRDGTPLTGSLTAEIWRSSFWGADRAVSPPFTITPGTGPEKHDYKFFFTFDEAEAYEIRIRFPTEDGHEIIPFPVVIGKTDDRPLILGAAGLLLGSVILVGTIKRRGRRRSGAAGARR